jgi:preprotein translocase subunit Sec63
VFFLKINKSIQTESFEVFILSEKMTHQEAKALFKDHGFDKFSTQKDLKKSYRSLAQKLHPDKKGWF